jgi:hypothetical protein
MVARYISSLLLAPRRCILWSVSGRGEAMMITGQRSSRKDVQLITQSLVILSPAAQVLQVVAAGCVDARSPIQDLQELILSQQTSRLQIDNP